MTVIQAENISKAYQLGEIGTGTISRDIERWWAKVRGKEDPFLRIGETNDRTSKGESDIVWSLKDINFEILQGDAVGIIGRNGAGKSTLLKLLSRITAPTTGSIKVKGRVASLLEVGTGFHPELTGRENIFLNGAILGMRKKEITRKFDEIVDFAGVERYVDTPVKRYSSGMYVRLAFAVAAYLESEILIVDEVLAVGDAEFQKKCLGKMGDISKGEGRTVLFVSHNMASITTLCNKAIILKNGLLQNNGEANSMVNEYMRLGSLTLANASDNSIVEKNKKLKIRQVAVQNQYFETVAEVVNQTEIYIELIFEVVETGKGYDIGFELHHENFGCIFSSTLKDTNIENYDTKYFDKGIYKYRVLLPHTILLGGVYYVKASAAIPKLEMLDVFTKEVQFYIIDTVSPIAKTTEGRNGCVVPILKWERC